MPRADRAWNVDDKLRRYVLNPKHSDGKQKATVFKEALCIGLEELEYLRGEILDGLATEPIIGVRGNAPYGVICEVCIPVRGLAEHEGRTIDITTIWELRDESADPKLVTAYPAR
jgi:hypothetical protein